jgi:hypothetical protein
VGTVTPAEASVMMVHAATHDSQALARSETGRASQTVLSLGGLSAQSVLSGKLPPTAPMDAATMDPDELLESRLRSMFVTGNLTTDVLNAETEQVSPHSSESERSRSEDSGDSDSDAANVDDLDTTVASGITLPESFRHDPSTARLSTTESLLSSMRGRTLANSLSQARMTSTYGYMFKVSNVPRCYDVTLWFGCCVQSRIVVRIKTLSQAMFVKPSWIPQRQCGA